MSKEREGYTRATKDIGSVWEIDYLSKDDLIEKLFSGTEEWEDAQVEVDVRDDGLSVHGWRKKTEEELEQDRQKALAKEEADRKRKAAEAAQAEKDRKRTEAHRAEVDAARALLREHGLDSSVIVL